MMNAILSNLFYLLRWGVWLIRWILFAAYGAVEFVSKPGSRLIVPVLAAAASYVYRLPLDAAIERYVLHVDWHHMHLQARTSDAMLVLGLVLATCAYVTLSRLLVLLLGAFPPVVRPLRPVRALRVKTRSIRAVVVRHAVPKLPRRRPALRIGHDPA